MIGVDARACCLLGSLAVAACGPELIEPAEHAEVCGEPSPFRILELDPDRPLARVDDVGFFGERRVLQVGYRDLDAGPSTSPRVESWEAWSMGPCGESPMRIGEDLRWIVDIGGRWPEVVFACRETTGEIVALDPSGLREPHVVFETNACAYDLTRDGVVTLAPHDEQLGALILHPYPDDPWDPTAEPIVLLDPVRVRPAEPTGWRDSHRSVVSVTEDDAFAITADADLVHISLADRTVSTEASNVREFFRSADARYLLWQDATVTNDDPDWPHGDVFFRDRQSGTTTRLLETALSYSGAPFMLIDSGVLHVDLEEFGNGASRFYFLPELSHIDVPFGTMFVGRAEDGRLVVGGKQGFGPFTLLDVVTGESETLLDRQGGLRWTDAGLEVIEGVVCCLTDSSNRDEGRLWSLRWDADPYVLAPRATHQYARLHDGRVVTPLDLNKNWIGNLVVVDAALAEQLVDTDVLAFSVQSQRSGDDTFVYAVTDPERSGVWLARLGPARE